MATDCIHLLIRVSVMSCCECVQEGLPVLRSKVSGSCSYTLEAPRCRLTYNASLLAREWCIPDSAHRTGPWSVRSLKVNALRPCGCVLAVESHTTTPKIPERKRGYITGSVYMHLHSKRHNPAVCLGEKLQLYLHGPDTIPVRKRVNFIQKNTSHSTLAEQKAG